MKVRTRISSEEGMRQTILRAIRSHNETPMIEMPPACCTIDEDIAFAAGPDGAGLKGPQEASSSGILGPAPRRFFMEVAHA